jgi:hypothetical protein
MFSEELLNSEAPVCLVRSQADLSPERAIELARESGPKLVALAEQVAADRDEWQRHFVELGEVLTVKIGEAIDLLKVGRTQDAVALLEAIMGSLDKIADPTKRGEK